jgi:hypothetical protein
MTNVRALEKDLRRVLEVMKSANAKPPEHSMSIWDIDVAAIENAANYLAAQQALAATPADHGFRKNPHSKTDECALCGRSEASHASATPAVGGEALAAATIELNGLLDKYWMGENSKTNIIAMCAAQQKCKDALDKGSNA